ncbi:MAG: peptidoglycan-associated lipoprotein [Proteobacteria bacterium]|nr:MAG: peptidoglycan-associated lipoprotein [Pseudomonadota bacterium]
MKKHGIFVAAALAVFLSFAGCKSAKKVEDGEGAGGVSSENMNQGADDNTMGDSDSGRAMGLQTIYFKYDSSDISGDAKATADANVTILKANAAVKVQVEGHCDQRGGIQYNIALGEKRANAVKNYLRKAGIAADRLSIISYGKEKLVDTAMTEEAYGKNRRANFVITSK